MNYGASFGDSTMTGGTDSGASPQDSTKFNDSGTSPKNSTKFSSSGLSCEDSTKLENSLDTSSLDPSVFEEESSSREKSAEADTSWKPPKQVGPHQSYLRQRNRLLTKASTSSDEDDSQDLEPVQAIQPRRSLRSTKGVPLLGMVMLLPINWCAHISIMKNGKIQLPSKL